MVCELLCCLPHLAILKQSTKYIQTGSYINTCSGKACTSLVVLTEKKNQEIVFNTLRTDGDDFVIAYTLGEYQIVY